MSFQNLISTVISRFEQRCCFRKFPAQDVGARCRVDPGEQHKPDLITPQVKTQNGSGGPAIITEGTARSKWGSSETRGDRD
jgi:hypothetical protein